MLLIVRLLLISLFIGGKGLRINPSNKKFPKITYTKIHDISYRGPIYVSRKKPYTFMLFAQLDKILSKFVNNYIDHVYSMASLPLSFIIINKLNITNDNNNNNNNNSNYSNYMDNDNLNEKL